jgi:hypothetical protein
MNWFRRLSQTAQQAVYYRGAPQIDHEPKTRSFPGVYLTSRLQTAMGYGQVGMYRLTRNLNLLDANSPAGKRIAQYFMRQNDDVYEMEQADARRKYNNDIYQANPIRQLRFGDENSVYLYPTEDFVKTVQRYGYQGWKNDEDIFVFDPANIQFIGPYQQQGAA